MGISRESAWRPRQSPAGPGVRPEIPAPTERLVPPPPPPSHQLADRRPQTLLQNPSLISRLYPERAVDGHELPAALGTAPSGILSETHLGSNLRFKPQNEAAMETGSHQRIRSHPVPFPLLRESAVARKLGDRAGHETAQKMSGVFFSLHPRKNETDVAALYSC